MKVKIILCGDGCSEGIFECTEEQFSFLEYVESCAGNVKDERYAPCIIFEKVEE